MTLSTLNIFLGSDIDKVPQQFQTIQARCGTEPLPDFLEESRDQESLNFVDINSTPSAIAETASANQEVGLVVPLLQAEETSVEDNRPDIDANSDNYPADVPVEDRSVQEFSSTGQFSIPIANSSLTRHVSTPPTLIGTSQASVASPVPGNITEILPSTLQF